MYSKWSSRVAALVRGWRTLAFRLTAGYAIAGLFLVFAATASLYFVLRSELERSTDQFLADKLHVLRTMLRDRPDDWDALHEEIELESAARKYEHFYVRLLDPQNQPQLMTPGMAEQLDLSRFATPSQSQFEHAIAMKGAGGRPFRITSATAAVGLPARGADTIQIAIDISQQEELLARYRFWFWTILTGSSVLFPLIGYQVARHGIRPVEEMGRTARQISSTTLHERIRAEGYPSELASLAGTFNEMLDRLEESFERISRFSADIAHDLRTPVNNIRGETEVALARARTIDEYREVLESCLEESVRLSELISDLLFLARAESPLNHLHREAVNVGELLDGMREYYEASAEENSISLANFPSEIPIMAELDRKLVQRAVGNLISNALAHTPPGGSIRLGASAENGSVRIDVSDTGTGIPADALPRVFDRFFRVDTSRAQASGGTGLGLAIVQSIMILHGGKVEIGSQLGQGTCVTLDIPLSAVSTSNGRRTVIAQS